MAQRPPRSHARHALRALGPSNSPPSRTPPRIRHMRLRLCRSSARRPGRRVNPARSPPSSLLARLPLRADQLHAASSGHTSPPSYPASRRLPQRTAPTTASHPPTLRMGGRTVATRQVRRQAAGSSPSRDASQGNRASRDKLIKEHEVCHILLARAHRSSVSNNSQRMAPAAPAAPAVRRTSLMASTTPTARQIRRSGHRVSRVSRAASHAARPIPAAMAPRRGSAGTPAGPISSATSPAGVTSRRQIGVAPHLDADSHSRDAHRATRLAIPRPTSASRKPRRASSR